jgi:hypothetical protein
MTAEYTPHIDIYIYIYMYAHATASSPHSSLLTYGTLLLSMPSVYLYPIGLGHPAIFEGSAQPGPAGAAVREVFTTFGAVPVLAR